MVVLAAPDYIFSPKVPGLPASPTPITITLPNTKAGVKELSIRIKGQQLLSLLPVGTVRQTANYVAVRLPFLKQCAQYEYCVGGSFDPYGYGRETLLSVLQQGCRQRAQTNVAWAVPANCSNVVDFVQAIDQLFADTTHGAVEGLWAAAQLASNSVEMMHHLVSILNTRSDPDHVARARVMLIQRLLEDKLPWLADKIGSAPVSKWSGIIKTSSNPIMLAPAPAAPRQIRPRGLAHYGAGDEAPLPPATPVQSPAFPPPAQQPATPPPPPPTMPSYQTPTPPPPAAMVTYAPAPAVPPTPLLHPSPATVYQPVVSAPPAQPPPGYPPSPMTYQLQPLGSPPFQSGTGGHLAALQNRTNMPPPGILNLPPIYEYMNSAGRNWGEVPARRGPHPGGLHGPECGCCRNGKYEGFEQHSIMQTDPQKYGFGKWRAFHNAWKCRKIQAEVEAQAARDGKSPEWVAELLRLHPADSF